LSKCFILLGCSRGRKEKRGETETSGKGEGAYLFLGGTLITTTNREGQQRGCRSKSIIRKKKDGGSGHRQKGSLYLKYGGEEVTKSIP